jgi:hypothetical protein
MNTSGNDSLRGSKIENQSFSETINLKIARLPASYYRLIQCERSLLKDYNAILQKIKSLQEFSNKYIVTLYVKSTSREDIRVTNEQEWNQYLENNMIIELIDSKNTLKIEYELSKGNTNNTGEMNEEKVLEAKCAEIFENEKISTEILRSIFSQVMKSETLRNKVKEDIILNNQQQTENIKNYLNGKSFDILLKKFLDKTLENFKYINNIKGTIGKELEDDKSTSDILLFDNNDDYMNIPSFIEFFNKSDKEEFKSRISHTFSEFKK